MIHIANFILDRILQSLIKSVFFQYRLLLYYGIMYIFCVVQVLYFYLHLSVLWL